MPTDSPNAKTPKANILIVEDEPDIAEFVATELRLEGYAVRVEPDGLRGWNAARQSPPDLILLDRMLPGLNGVEFCRRWRAVSDVPIIMLTALGETRERVEGLNAGANDYLPKPFDLDELLARIKAQLRAHKPEPKRRYELADLSLDLDKREVRRAGARVELTPKEFDLLGYLLQHAGQVRTREQILQAVWGYDFEGEDNVLDVYMRYVRNKVERPELPRLIHTVRGVGYILREDEAAT